MGALAELHKANNSVVMSVCPSIRIQQLGCHWTNFHEISHLSILRKYFEEQFKSHYNLTAITAFYMKTDVPFLSYLAHYFLESEMYQTDVQKVKTHILFSVTLSRKSYRL